MTSAIHNQPFIDELLRRVPATAPTVWRLLETGAGHYQILVYVIHEGMLPAKEALSIWADALGVACVDMHDTLFQPEVVAILDKEFISQNAVIPLYRMAEVVTMAMADPRNNALIAKVENHIGGPISPVFALEEDILDAAEVQCQSPDELSALLDTLDLSLLTGGQEITKAALENISGQQAIIKFTRSLLLLAVKENASDIHIEPFEHHVLIRFRIDGVLSERLKLANDILPALTSRLKVESGMNIIERRRPQDGRLSLELATKSIGFRASTVPAIYGEKTVLRLLGQIHKRSIPTLEELNFSKQIYQWCKRLINTPSGAFFITGPTGSGKTTTLFSALQSINSPERNIMTIEDPVEYRLPGINQIQVNPAIDLTFSKVLRSLLRQDPDVILVGEIRDLESAKIAVEAALTGHLVFATLHTNNAIQAVTRLVDIGVNPFLVGPSLIGVISQRLARRVCPDCRESYTLGQEKMDELFTGEGLEPLTLYRSKGCPSCKFTGYSGRLALHEMIMVEENLRKLVVANAPISALRETARQHGYKTMYYDGVKKAIRGLTTLEEVERVVPRGL